MNELGLNFDSDKYKKTLKIIQNEAETKDDLLKLNRSKLDKIKDLYI